MLYIFTLLLRITFPKISNKKIDHHIYHLTLILRIRIIPTVILRITCSPDEQQGNSDHPKNNVDNNVPIRWTTKRPIITYIILTLILRITTPRWETRKQIIYTVYFASQREVSQHAGLYSLRPPLLFGVIWLYYWRQYTDTTGAISEPDQSPGFLLPGHVRSTKSLLTTRRSSVWCGIPRSRS